MTILRTYSELRKLETFEDRYDYLRLIGSVGNPTFGFERFLNQTLYHSEEWKDVRRRVIVRDNACDLGIPGRELFVKILVHHINPITIDDIEMGSFKVLDMENLITTSHKTHQAIHYGDKDSLQKLPIKRTSGDTRLWGRREERRSY